MTNNNLQLEYQTAHFKLTATTGYQFLSDSMIMDQDFTSNSVFTLTQTQKLHNITEEILLRSTGASHVEWIIGAFGMFEHLKTHAPVVFEEDGVAMIQQFIPPTMPIYILNQQLFVNGSYRTTCINAAMFAQATWNNMFDTKLSLTGGLRLDYEENSLKALTATDITYIFSLETPSQPTTIMYQIDGKSKIHSLPILPKVSLTYNVLENYMFYVSVAKGYRSGGHNIQMFSDLLQNKIKTDPLNFSQEPIDIEKAVSYKPEYSMNFELGSRGDIVKKRLWTNIALFYINLNDQQIAEFAPTGAGRMIKNAGKSRSYGLEIAFHAIITQNVDCNIAYGFSDATFTQYIVRINDVKTQDFSGKKVPFVPQHTLSAACNYTRLLNKRWIDKINVSVQGIGAGKIYWTENNDIYQPFYALLNAKITFEKQGYQLSLWGKNLTNNNYLAFYFETMGNSFAQKGKPIQYGITLSAKIKPLSH
jgi:outer membrane receptor protein involved in Fe transport